jgi:hypothetical protein
MAQLKTICPHCYRQSADHRICTSLGCGKRIAEPVVKAFTRNRRKPMGRKRGGFETTLARKRRRGRT